MRYQTQLKQSWEVWMRYSQKLKHQNMIICQEYECYSESSFLQVFFIDKRKLEALINDYLQDFIEVLGEHFSIKKFILQLEKKENYAL